MLEISTPRAHFRRHIQPIEPSSGRSSAELSGKWSAGPNHSIQPTTVARSKPGAMSAEPRRLSRHFNAACGEAREILCVPIRYQCRKELGEDPKIRSGTRNYTMVAHCAAAHHVELVQVHGWWWLVPERGGV